MAELRECRCCRIGIPAGRLACAPHWRMLPAPLKAAISETYRRRDFKAYVKNVDEADRLWQEAGLWKPPVPMSRRADKGMDTLRAHLSAVENKSQGGGE
jgi:hypothetical protein